MTEPRFTVSRRTASLVIGGALLAAVAVLAVSFDPRSDASTVVPPPLPMDILADTPGLELPESGYLEPGEAAPPLDGIQWSDGEPLAATSYTGRITVLDLWGDWCPFARELSPGLIQMRHDFSDAPCEFVSVTTGPVPSGPPADRGWISGYDTTGALAPFRCLFQDVTYGVTVHPTIYLIGSDGKILWNDGGMRESHADSHEVEQAVRLALRDALSVMKSPGESDIPPPTVGNSRADVPEQPPL